MTTRFYLTVALCGVLAGSVWGGPVIVPDDQLKLGDTALPSLWAPDYVMPRVMFMDSAAGTEGAGAMKTTAGLWSLKRYSIGRTFSEQPKDCSVGDWCTQFPVDSREIDWVRTFDAVRESEAYKNGYIEVFDTTDSADRHLLFTRVGTVEIRFVQTNGRSAWKTYAVGRCSHPNWLYATRAGEGNTADYLDLSGKHVQFFGDPNLITPQYSEPQGGVSNVIWGLDYDKDDTQRLMARYRVIDESQSKYDSPQGQFVLAYYKTELKEEQVSATVVEIVPLGVSTGAMTCQMTLPPGLEGCGYVVSNLTTGVEVKGVGSTTYDLPIGAKVAVYAAPADGYVVVGTNPYVIDEVTAETTLEGVVLPMAVLAGDSVEYLDWDDVNKEMKSATCTAYEPYVGQRILDAGKTYVLKADQTVVERIVVNGTPDSPTRLILCDGAKLTANGGIGVASDKALVICGQALGTGLLTAFGEDFAAGIGGGYNGAVGTVTVNGGAVTATGEAGGAGIGGGAFGAGGAVTINGGTVTATGGQEAAGIGGGYNAEDDGVVTFGEGYASGVVAGADAASAVYLTTAEYAADHRAKYVTMPRFALRIPKAMTGYSYVVSNETAELKGSLADGINTYVVVPGATVKVYFTPSEDYGWQNEFENPKNLGAITVDKSLAAEDLPTATRLCVAVTVGRLEHMTAAWTSGEGTVTNAIHGGTFKAPIGVTGAKVVFTPEANYRFAGADETGVRALDSPLTMDCAVTPPEVEGIPGTIVNPWTVGEGMTAYVEDGTLYIDGAGAVTSMPWAESADGIKKLAMSEGVTGLQEIVRTLPDLAAVNGLAFDELSSRTGGLLPADIAAAKVDAATQAATITVEVKTTETETNQVWTTVVTTNIVVPVEAPVGYLKLVTKPAEEE